MAEDNSERAPSLSSIFFFLCIAEDNDEPPHSLLSFTTPKKKKKNPTEDDKPSSLLSSFITQEKNLDVGFSWVVGDNNGPPGLSSCFNFFSSFAENNKSRGSLLFLGFIP